MKFIQVGVGGFGRVWVRNLRDNEQAEVVAMVDVNDVALAAACEEGGYSRDICYASLEQALDAVEADAVVCVTPPEYHKPPVVAAMQAGLHAISEKPMADCLANCKDMLRTSHETGKTYVVSQNYRYAPATWTLAESVRKGMIGEIGQVKVDFYLGNDFHGGFRHEMDFPLIVDMSIHHFDLMRFITGLDAVAVSGVCWNPPWSNYKGDCSSSVVFEMNNGARVVYNASWCAKGQFQGWDGAWQIEGEKGTLTYSKGGDIRFYDVPELYKVESETVIEKQSPPLGGQAFVLDDFLKSVATGSRPKTDVCDNIRSVAMVFSAVEALRTGKKVPVLDAEIQSMITGR